MTKELLGTSALSGSAAHDSASLGLVPVLPWMPKTTAAVALRLFELDASIIYVKNEKPKPSADKPVKLYMKLSSRYSPFKNEDVELKDTKQEEHIKEDIVDLRGKQSSYKRGRGRRDQGPPTKWQRRMPGLKSDTGRKSSSRGTQNLNQGPRQQGKKTNLQATSRGRRTVRKRRVEKMQPKEPLLGRMTDKVASTSYLSKKSAVHNNYVKPFGNIGDEDWSVKKGRMNGDDNSNIMEEAESDDNVEEVYGQGNWEPGFNGISNGWNRNPMEVSDDDANVSNGIEAMGDDDSEGDMEMSDGSDRAANRVQSDEGMDSADSDEYSD